jgi:hypothetical protein
MWRDGTVYGPRGAQHARETSAANIRRGFKCFWDVGARVTWALNDVFGSGVTGDEQHAHAVIMRAHRFRDAAFL